MVAYYNFIAQFGGWLLTDIPGCIVWSEADFITGLNDGDPIGTWLDFSGNNNHAVQSTAGYKPLFKTSIQNGLPGILFDGTDDYLDATGMSNATSNYTFFFVLSETAMDLVSWDTCNLVDKRLHFRPQGNVGVGHGLYQTVEDGAQGTPDAFPTSTQLFEYVLESAASGRVYRNGNLVTSGLAYTQQPINSNRTTIGCSFNFAYFWDKYIFGIVGYNSALSDSNRLLVRNYFNTKYAIY